MGVFVVARVMQRMDDAMAGLDLSIGDSEILLLVQAYQSATRHHLGRSSTLAGGSIWLHQTARHRS